MSAEDLTSGDVELLIREGDIATAQCEAKRQLLVQSWPKNTPVKKGK